MRTKWYRRAWRTTREILRVGWRDFQAPLFDRYALWAILQVPVNLALLYIILGTTRMIEEWTVTSVALLAFWASIPVWALINFFRAPFVFAKEERERGQWHGERFVFHEPIRIATIVLRPGLGPQRWVIPVSYGEAHSLIGYKVTVDKAAGRARIMIGRWPGFDSLAYGNSEPSGGVRIGSRREIEIDAQSMPETVDIVIRVYQTYWEW